MIKAAIFDMDGLMFDTERLVYNNWQQMLDEAGYDYNIEMFKQTVGKRKKEVHLYYLSQYGDDFPYWEFADKGKAGVRRGCYKRQAAPRGFSHRRLQARSAARRLRRV